MPRYLNIKCPHCNFNFEHLSIGVIEKVGHSFNICPNCRNLYATGMKYWFEMNESERLKYITSRALSTIYSSFLYTIGASLLVMIIYSSQSWFSISSKHEATALGVTSLFLFSVFCIIIYKKISNHVKKYSEKSLKENHYKLLMSGNIGETHLTS